MLWSEGVLYKRQPPLCLTHCRDQREGEREMEQVTAVGKGTTFFLLLVLAASASATSLNTTQQNTAITATSGKQVRGVWGVHVHEPKIVGALTIHTIQPHSLFLQKKVIPTFP